jgi:hypothetical protein
MNSIRNTIESAWQILLFSAYLSTHYPLIIRHTPRPTKLAAIAKLNVHSKIFLPNFLKSTKVGKTDTKLTNPTRAVTRVDFIPVDLRIELE